MSKKLTAKERRFVEEYCVDFNTTKAAARAGYSTRSRNNGYKIVHRPRIAAAIIERRAILEANTDITIKRVRDELWKLATEGEQEAVRRSALADLMRHLGGFVDKVEQKITGGKLAVTVVYGDGPPEDAE